MVDDEKAILERKMAAATARLEQLRRDNREMEINIIICDVIAGRRRNLDDLAPDLVDDIGKVVAKRRHEVQKRIQELRSMNSSKPT
ncbi:hypothetical protein E2562_019336 [Oryza meyeriana var. granulata]|uniref:Uncharacterized protein n=1 Tax=Oryza meyeriana var. granulata TaxID=110450 RepID=A0A6G1BKG3_9ORYZ|nr:hypothetical protein E2562_019336 [Oryza meyeriana var. granulata]